MVENALGTRTIRNCNGGEILTANTKLCILSQDSRRDAVLLQKQQATFTMLQKVKSVIYLLQEYVRRLAIVH